MVVDADNKVSVRTVRIGDKSDKDVVVLDGLSSGERVIVEGMQKVRPGGQVNPTTGEKQRVSLATTPPDATPCRPVEIQPKPIAALINPLTQCSWWLLHN